MGLFMCRSESAERNGDYNLRAERKIIIHTGCELDSRDKRKYYFRVMDMTAMKD